MAVIDLTPASVGIEAPRRVVRADGPVAAPMAGPAAALAEFANTLSAMEQRTRQAREQREQMTAGAEYAEGLAELRGRMERNDPEFAADPVAAFRTGAERLRGEIAGRFGASGEQRAAFESRARVTAAGDLPAVVRWSTQREAERTQATLADTLAGLARGAGSETDPLARRGRVEQATAAIDGAVETGAISAVQAQRLRETFRASLDQADVLRLINRNPGEAARALADPARFENLDPVQRERLFGTAQSAAAAAAARAEAAEARRERALANEMRLVDGLLSAGIVPEERVGRLLEAARGTAIEADLRQAVQDGRDLAAFRVASNEQQMQALAEADAAARGANATDADLGRLTRLQRVRQAQITAYQRDGLGAAVAEGLVEPQPPIDWGDAASLNSRVEAAAGVSQRRGYGISPFNAEDLAAGVAAFQSNGPNGKLAIVQALVNIADPAVRVAALQHFERARGDAGRLPPGTLARIGDMLRAGTPETVEAARRIIGNLTADVSDRAKQIGESSEMNAALVTVQGSGVQGVRVRAAAVAGGGPYAEVVSRDMDAIRRYAAARMAAGESSATGAVRAAQGEWNAGLLTVDDTGLAHVYFPADRANARQVTTGLRLLRDQSAAVDTDPAMGADAALGAISRREAARRAVWINEGGTFALVGRGDGGAPVVLRTATLDEVVGAATAQAAADQARPPVMRREDTLEQSRREAREAEQRGRQPVPQ